MLLAVLLRTTSPMSWNLLYPLHSLVVGVYIETREMPRARKEWEKLLITAYQEVNDLLRLYLVTMTKMGGTVATLIRRSNTFSWKNWSKEMKQILGCTMHYACSKRSATLPHHWSVLLVRVIVEKVLTRLSNLSAELWVVSIKRECDIRWAGCETFHTAKTLGKGAFFSIATGRWFQCSYLDEKNHGEYYVIQVLRLSKTTTYKARKGLKPSHLMQT